MSSLSEKILRAKVPQLLGTYLAIGFGMLQFVEFINNRYAFNSVWVDRYLLIWLGMIPAVALLIYYRGLPKKAIATGSGWKTSLIFANLGLVGILAIILSNSPATVETETVAFVDEAGVSQERQIPAKSSIQKIGFFPVENAGGETNAENWWGLAYAWLLESTLSQRPEVITVNPMALVNYYDEFGAKPYDKTNLATQRKIAQENRTNYFVSLSHRTSENSYELSGGLYRTRDGKEVRKLSATSGTAFEAIDLLNQQIDDYLPALGDVARYTSDLPASALMTDSETALEAISKGMIAFQLNPGDLATAIGHLENSVKADPACAICAYMLGDKYYGLGQVDTARVLLSQAVRLSEVLPEREQFLYKFTLLQLNQQHEATSKIMESYRKLYPYDYLSYQALEHFYVSSYGVDSAIHLMEIAAEISDRPSALDRLYALHRSQEDYAAAEKIMETQQQEFPDEDVYRFRRADLYQKTGRTDEARELLREMTILDPLNLEPLLELAKLEKRQSNYPEAEKLLKDVLRKSTTVSDSTGAYGDLIGALSGQGRIEEALDVLADFERFQSKTLPMNRIKFSNYYTRVNLAMRTNDRVGIRSAHEDLRQYDSNMAEVYRCLVPYTAIIYLYDGIDNGAEKLEECSTTLASLGVMFASYSEYGRLFYDGNFGEAADFAAAKQTESIDLSPPVVDAFINRLAERFDAAREILDRELAKEPKNPRLLLEKARLDLATDQPDAARTALENVLETYRNADSDFVPAQRARELLAGLVSR